MLAFSKVSAELAAGVWGGASASDGPGKKATARLEAEGKRLLEGRVQATLHSRPCFMRNS